MSQRLIMKFAALGATAVLLGGLAAPASASVVRGPSCSSSYIAITGDPGVVSGSCFGPATTVTVDFYNFDYQYATETVRADINGMFSAPLISLADVFVPEYVQAFAPASTSNVVIIPAAPTF